MKFLTRKSPYLQIVFIVLLSFFTTLDTVSAAQTWYNQSKLNGNVVEVGLNSRGGHATGTQTLTISNASEMVFWYRNPKGNLMDAHPTMKECVDAHTAYNNDPSNGVVDKAQTSCAGGTQAQWDDLKAKDFLVPNGAVVIDPNKTTPTTVSDTYMPLAPLTSSQAQGVKSTGIGDYFNTMFKLAIALCAGLAVIMIVIGGVQYMGDESVFGKTEAKSKIMQAILGLFIALGSYAILNTIDPALLGKGGVQIDQVIAEIDKQTAAIDAQETTSSGGGVGTTRLCSDVASCKSLCSTTNNGSNYNDTPPGVMNANLVQSIGSNIPLVTPQPGCKNCSASASVIQGLKNLKPVIDTLISQNQIPNRKYTFSVISGYRPAKDQIRLMCMYITNNPSGLGHSYAYPAKSNHGVGTAIDIKFFWDGNQTTNCGSARQEGTIEKVMDKAGFQRLVGESWHFEYAGGAQTCKYPNCPAPKLCSVPS